MDIKEFLEEWNNSSDKLLVHTSGSTGKPKPMWVEKRRMAHSARTTCAFLGLQPGDTAFLCMSLDYIAGKMMAVRAIEWGLKLVCVEPSGHPMSQCPSFGGGGEVLAAMTPMQVYNTLQVPEERERLMQVKHLLIGGGAIDGALERELQSFTNNVWSTYGMTETLSHIALRRINGTSPSPSEGGEIGLNKDIVCLASNPPSFGGGGGGYYTPFPDVSVSLNAEGCLIIDAPGVCAEPLITNDCAELHPDGRRFRIIGRKDNVINCGGIKVHAEEVEKMLRPHLSVPFIVSKAPDPKFGEVVALVFQDTKSVQYVKELCETILPKYWQPRRYLSVKQILTTETGKPRRDINLYF